MAPTPLGSHKEVLFHSLGWSTHSTGLPVTYAVGRVRKPEMPVAVVDRAKDRLTPPQTGLVCQGRPFCHIIADVRFPQMDKFIFSHSPLFTRGSLLLFRASTYHLSIEIGGQQVVEDFVASASCRRHLYSARTVATHGQDRDDWQQSGVLLRPFHLRSTSQIVHSAFANSYV